MTYMHTFFFRNNRASRLQEKLENTTLECSSTATLRSFSFIDWAGAWKEQRVSSHIYQSTVLAQRRRLYLTKYSFAKFLDLGFGSNIHMQFFFCIILYLYGFISSGLFLIVLFNFWIFIGLGWIVVVTISKWSFVSLPTMASNFHWQSLDAKTLLARSSLILQQITGNGYIKNSGTFNCLNMPTW